MGKRFNVILEESLFTNLKIFCAENNKKMSDIVRDLIEEFLKKEDING